MNTPADHIQHLENLFNTKAQPSQNQQRAFATFKKQGLPHYKMEQWKYCDTTRIPYHDFQIANTTVSQVQSLEAHFLDNTTARIVFINGKHQPNHSRYDQVTSLSADKDNAFSSESEMLNPFVSLNKSYLQQHYEIHLTADTTELHLYYFSVGTESYIHSLRTHIITAENAKCTVVEYHINLSDVSQLNNNITQITIKDSSDLQHITLENNSSSDRTFSTLHVNQGNNCQFRQDHFPLNGQLSRKQVQIELNGEGSTTHCQAFNLAQNTEVRDLHYHIYHHQPNNSSNILVRGISNHQARSACTGCLQVQPNAVNSSAHFENKNLLLSSQAEVDTRPQLEIYNNDVQCTHGATIGALDNDALFYLQSRGVDEQTAKQMLIDAFMEPVLADIELESVKRFLQQKLAVLGANDAN